MGPVWAHTAEIVCCHTYDKQPHFLNSIFCGNLDIQMFQVLRNTKLTQGKLLTVNILKNTKQFCKGNSSSLSSEKSLTFWSNGDGGGIADGQLSLCWKQMAGMLGVYCLGEFCIACMVGMVELYSIQGLLEKLLPINLTTY